MCKYLLSSLYSTEHQNVPQWEYDDDEIDDDDAYHDDNAYHDDDDAYHDDDDAHNDNDATSYLSTEKSQEEEMISCL